MGELRESTKLVGDSWVPCIHLGYHSHGMSMDYIDQSSGSHKAMARQHGNIVPHA